MKLGKLLLSALAGGSLAVGSRLVVRSRRERLAHARRDRDLLVRIADLALRTLSEMRGGGRVSASETYFFIWVVERVAERHNVDPPGFRFDVKDGKLASSRLTFILRRMLADGELKMDDNHLEPVWEAELPELDRDRHATLEKVGMIIDEVAAEWDQDMPEDQLVRFGKLFK